MKNKRWKRETKRAIEFCRNAIMYACKGECPYKRECSIQGMPLMLCDIREIERMYKGDRDVKRRI